ncbi:MAG: glycosyltransferase [Lutibacter sp.]|nr:glycosyltransferase [Lutibacter sp.]
MKIVFWQNIISPHQSFLIRELANKNDVTLVVEKEMSEDRVKQGWERPNLGNAKIVLLLDENILSKIIKETKGSIHIFSGFTGFPILKKAFKTIINSQNVGIISESAIQLGWKKYFRYFLYRYYFYKYGNKIDFILAMGKLGVNWYKLVGFNKNKIFEFQYFTELPKDKIGVIQKRMTISFLFIGQLILRKGIDNLLYSLNQIKDYNWELNIIGDGILKENLINYINKKGLTDKIHFHNNMNNESAMSFLSKKADYLILPSRFDGWGAVINESLSRGVKVIVSNKCGGSSLIRNSKYGFVYNEKNLKELVLILKSVINGNKTSSLEDRIALSKDFEINFSFSRVDDCETILKGFK